MGARRINLEALPPLPDEWQDSVNRLVARCSEGSLYLVGEPDTGKTTLALHLVARLAQRSRVAFLDGDPGQSTLGVPSTLALGLLGPGGEKMLWTEALAFVGDVSPRGHLLQALSGLLLLQRRAHRLGARVCVVDGCGFVRGQPAGEFQVNLIHLLAPRHLIVLQAREELAPLVSNFAHHPGIHLHFLPPSPLSQPRSYQERQAYRRQLLAGYFGKATLQQLRWRHLGLHGMLPDLHNPTSCQHRLVALCAADKLVLALALVQRWDQQKGEALLLAPPFPAEKLASIQFGSLRLTLESLYNPPIEAPPGENRS